MKQVNWQEILIRCSSLSCLFTEPQAKADKEAGLLSKTAKNHLKSIYIAEKYGREKDIVTKPMKKGIECEDASIEMLSTFHEMPLSKNTTRLSNGYITGLPDIFYGDNINRATHITDVKTCADIWTFHDKIGEPIPPAYFYQLQGYLWLSNCKSADISYCLTDSNEQMILDEQMKAFRFGNFVTEESPEYRLEAAKIEQSMTYPDIRLEEKIAIFLVDRDEEIISKIPEKVQKARQYLAEYEALHLTFNK